MKGILHLTIFLLLFFHNKAVAPNLDPRKFIKLTAHVAPRLMLPLPTPDFVLQL